MRLHGHARAAIGAAGQDILVSDSDFSDFGGNGDDWRADISHNFGYGISTSESPFGGNIGQLILRNNIGGNSHDHIRTNSTVAYDCFILGNAPVPRCRFEESCGEFVDDCREGTVAS